MSTLILINKNGTEKKVYPVDLDGWLKDGWNVNGQTITNVQPIIQPKVDLKALLVGLKGISEKNVQEVLDISPTLEMVKSMNIEQWTEISGIGAERAENLIEELMAL